VAFRYFHDPALRHLPPRSAHHDVSRRKRHVSCTRVRLTVVARNSLIHGFVQRTGATFKTFDARAWQCVFSQFINWPAFAGRGGAEAGAVLFVFL
jgi:hypothetical protein